MPQTAWLGLRGLFRKRGRAVLTLLALSFSAAAFLAIQTTTYSVNRFTGDLFSQYGADLFVFTGGQPQPLAQIRGQLLSVPKRRGGRPIREQRRALTMGHRPADRRRAGS